MKASIPDNLKYSYKVILTVKSIATGAGEFRKLNDRISEAVLWDRAHTVYAGSSYFVRSIRRDTDLICVLFFTSLIQLMGHNVTRQVTEAVNKKWLLVVEGSRWSPQNRESPDPPRAGGVWGGG